MTTTNFKQENIDLVNTYLSIEEALSVRLGTDFAGLFGAGLNLDGVFGTGNNNNIFSLMSRFNNSPNWASVVLDRSRTGRSSFSNSSSLLINSFGNLFGAGYNGAGQLGLGTITSFEATPVQIGANTWSDVTTNGKSTLAIRSNGTLWSWGSNYAGVLGLGNTTDRSSPVQVGALTNWSKIFVGGENAGFTLGYNQGASSFGIKTDGTLWSWGINTYGQLGLGNTTDRSSPVQVGGLSNWKQVVNNSTKNIGNTTVGSTTIAVKTDGTLWSWGSGQDGLRGSNNTTTISSPVQVGSLTNWSKISISSSHALAIKTDGTLWAWGYNINGQLGLSDLTTRSSPVQVGTLTNWSEEICCSNGNYRSQSSFGIKTDGTLWAWGSSNYGRLGLTPIDSIPRSSPVQVGSLNTWKKVASKTSDSTIAILGL